MTWRLKGGIENGGAIEMTLGSEKDVPVLVFPGEPFNTTVLTQGTCFDSTEALLRTPACLNSLVEEPDIIRQTLELLVQYSWKKTKS